MRILKNTYLKEYILKMWTKTNLTRLAIFLSFLYLVPLFFLPESIVGVRGEDVFFHTSKLFFLSTSAAITTTIVLIFVVKREYVRNQILTMRRFKYLLYFFVKRDFLSRYRKSILGVFWSLLNPLLTMLVMTLIFSSLFKVQIPNFPVYLLSGQILFNFFSEATNLAMGSVIAGEGIIKKVYVPKYIFPLSKVISALVNLMFSTTAFLIIYFVTSTDYQWTLILIVIPMLYTFVFALGLALLLSSLAVFFRDLSYLYGVLLTIFMYFTPIFYPVSILPDYLVPIIGLNPLYHYIDYFRSLALEGVIPGVWENMVCIGFALASFCCGLYVFISQQDKHILYL